MLTTVVAVERDDLIEKTVYGSSGIMIDGKYVLCTAHVLLPIFNDHFYENWHSITPGKLHCFPHASRLPEVRITCHSNTGQAKYAVKRGEVFAFFFCADLKSAIGRAFQGWAVDSVKNSRDLETVLSLFAVIRVVKTVNITTFKETLSQWWAVTKNESVLQAEEIVIRSVPFGNKFFLDSYSKGIVSNVLGDNSSMIVSDCPITPGSEGSPVYKMSSETEIPFGMVISSSCWWRREWTGLTLIVNMRSILMELLEYYDYKPKLKNMSQQLAARVESSLLHIYCGLQRGTAIIINATEGILLTNSHVVSDDRDIEIFWRDEKVLVTLLYRTPDNEVYDLAVLHCNPVFFKTNNLQSIQFSQETASFGLKVTAVGFAIFSKGFNRGPTISKGYVTQCNQSMITTSCCVNPGMSGGALLNEKGELLGVIVCNTRVQDAVYPRLNMAIPYVAIHKTIQHYLKKKDPSILRQLSTNNRKSVSAWKYLEAKL